jgi:mono/diheme cytochrome c family protein
MRKTLLLLIAILVASLLLTACGGGGDTGGDTDVDAGKNLFSESVIGPQAGCVSCHSLDAGVVIVGPSMAGIGSRANADEIRESIVDPNATLADGFPADTMPNVWGSELSADQVDQLVAYLLTLK